MKTLIAAYLQNRYYDWSFIHSNDSLKRPEGKTLFVSSIFNIKEISSRIIILKSNQSYFLLHQLAMTLDKNDYVKSPSHWDWPFKESYVRSSFFKLQDPGNSFYNYEYYFSITKESWQNILFELKTSNAPLIPASSNEGLLRAVWLKYKSTIVSYRWEESSSGYEALEQMMNTLLNHALLRVKSTYKIQ